MSMPGERLKILHVVFSLDPGGMENGIVNVAAALDPKEFSVHVCCLNHGGEFVRRLPEPANVSVLGRRGGFSLRTVLRLARELRRINPAVVHTHNLGPLIYAVLATWGGRTRPILHGEHGVLPVDQCTPRRVRQRQWLYRCCRRIHTVSTGQKSQLQSLGLPDTRLVTLLNGVDTARFAPRPQMEARRQIGRFSGKSLVLGIVGRFVALKRHVELIEAFDGLAPAFPEAHLLVVGSGGDETDRIAARVAASPARERIHLAGFQADPRPYYQAMDLLVVPSIVEGMSNVVLEAMACGIPVLAHHACGNGEMLTQGEDGIVADLSSVASLREALEQLLREPERLQAMGRAARRHAEGKFSIAGMVANYAALYRELART